jgi:O-antigen ligase
MFLAKHLPRFARLNPTDPSIAMGLVAFLAPAMLLYAPLSMAVLLPFAVCGAAAARLNRNIPVFRFHAVTTGLLIGLVALAATSLLWSYDASSTLGKLPRTAAIVGAGILFISVAAGLTGSGRQRVANCLLAGLILALILIVIERLAGGLLLPIPLDPNDRSPFLNQFNRPLAVLSLLIWAAAVRLGRLRPWLGISLVVVAFGGSLLSPTAAASAALVVGAGAALLTAVSRQLGAAIVGTVIAAIILLAPTIERALPSPKALYEETGLPRSAYHRLIIWRFVSDRIEERPLLGWGFNQSRNIPGGKMLIDTMEDALPLHPHNGAFQLRLELGILGALFGAALFVATAEIVRRHGSGRMGAAGAMGTVTAAFVVFSLSYGVWQTWWISSLFLTAGFCVVTCGKPSED